MLPRTLDILWTYRTGLLGGLIVTLELAALIWGVGIILGTILGLLAQKMPRSFGYPVRIAASFLSAVPALVLIFWAYFPLQMLLGVDIDPFWTAGSTLALLNTISVADIIRNLLTDFPPQYRDAARVCGLSASTTFLRIELPLVIRQAIPSLLLLQVTMLHLTLFASLISVEDLFRVVQRINSSIYRPVEIYSALGLLFVAICLPIQLIAARLQRRFSLTLQER